MNCENIKEKLSLYIDNLLDPDEADKIREHIESCDSCRAYYNHLLKLSEMVDDFVISDNEEYWESQRDKVMDKIEQAESDKITEVKLIRKRSRLYRYLAVAASLVLVGFVSIYETQEYNPLKGLFDDSDMETTEQLLKKASVEDISVQGGRAGETSVEVGQPIKVAEDIKLSKDLSRPVVIEPVSVSKKRTDKSQTVSESKEITNMLEHPESEPVVTEPVSMESGLDLGEPIESSNYGELQMATQTGRVSNLPAEVEPLSFKAPESEVGKDKVLSQEEIQKKAVESLKKRGLDEEEAVMSFESDEGKDFMPEPQKEKDTTITEVNIYKIRLDSLEEKYEGIYSPHYQESSAKSRVGIHPDSLDTVILELAETCFQVGILSIDEKEREDMIEKLRRLSINGSPEIIEKIQRYIVLLLSAE